MQSELPERNSSPVLIQGSAAPVFRSEEASDSDLRCRKCSGVLVEGYFPDCFLDIRIRCACCGEITQTPRLPEGEILPHPIITLGETGNYLIGSTVSYNRSVALTTDHQIALNNNACAPRQDDDAAFEISEWSILNLLKQYEGISGQASAQRLAELGRYHAAGRSGSKELPFDWAIWTIGECLKSRTLNFDDMETSVALSRIFLFRKVLAIWGHHPRFRRIASEFSNPNAFLHTIGQFLLADFYYRTGVRIGFSVQDVHGQPKPDLYVRLGAQEKFFFEFKTPSSLMWDRHADATDEAIRKNVRSILKNNSQINRSRPGAVVLMANHPNGTVFRRAGVEARSFLQSKGRDKPNLAGIVAMHCGGVVREGSSTMKMGRGAMRIGVNLTFESVPNGFFRLPHNPLIAPQGTPQAPR